MDMSAAVFLILYTSWNFSQLLFYCWFADKVASAVRKDMTGANVVTVTAVLGCVYQPTVASSSYQSEEVSVSAYAAFRPDYPVGPLSGLTGPAGATLNLVTIRAQRPLHLTAGRFVNITLSLYLEVSRRNTEPAGHPSLP